jgi:hypothetical protein
MAGIRGGNFFITGRTLNFLRQTLYQEVQDMQKEGMFNNKKQKRLSIIERN